MKPSRAGAAPANDETDRIFLASDNGLPVCLRDSSAKYARLGPEEPGRPADRVPRA